jgi:acyl-CoA thioesterase-1
MRCWPTQQRHNLQQTGTGNNLRCHDGADRRVRAQSGGIHASGGAGERTAPGGAARGAGPYRRCCGFLKPLWLYVLAGIAACSDSAPSLAPLDAEAIILAFGDSLTYGTGAGREASYPAVLQELTGMQVINAGVPGEVTAEGLARLPGLLEQHRPALVILCHGGNDMLRRVNAEAVYGNLEAMIDRAHAHGAEVLLVGVPQPRLLFLEPAEIYDRLANDRHLVYLRDALPQLESDAGMKSDPIHLNREGYRRLAVAIHELMEAAGAVPITMLKTD